MYKVVALFAFLFAFASGGVVYPVYRCGGIGTPLQLRVSECDGYCTLVPGRLYTFEIDFLTSGQHSFWNVVVEIIYNGITYRIIDSTIPGIPPMPGDSVATVRFSITPNYILSGNEIEIRGNIRNSASPLLEICLAANMSIA